MSLFIAASALHWFITPAAHPDASAARSIGVGVQAVVGVATAWWCARTPRAQGASTIA